MKLHLETNSFAAACYDQNTIEELVTCLSGQVDRTDCDTWKLSDQEWRDAIADALMLRIIRRNRLPPELK
jgi:hypothetical protein